MLTILLYLSIVLAFISALVIVLSPASGILLLMLSKPIIDTSFHTPLLFGLPLTQIAGAGIPIIIIGYMLFSKGENRLKYMPLRTLWMIYAADIFMFSAIISYQQGIMPALDVFFRHLNGVIGFYMFQAFFREKEKMKKLFLVLVLAGLFPVLTTLFSIVTGIQWHQFEHQVTGLTLSRSAGLYFHIVTVRYYVYQTLAGILLYISVTNRMGMLYKAIGSGIGFTSLVVLYNTYSKAGFLEMGLWAFLWTTLQKKFISMTIIIITVLLIIPFYASDIVDTVNIVFFKEISAISTGKETDIILAGRLFNWEVLLAEWNDLSMLFKMFGSGIVMTGAHNDHIMMLYHGGILGFIIYLVLLFAIGVRLVSELRRKVDPLGVVALMFYCTFFIEAIGLEPSAYPHFQWMVWGIVGLFLRVRADERRAARSSSARTRSSLAST